MNFLNRHRIITIVAIVLLLILLLFGGPLIINWLYDIPAVWSFFEMNWTVDTMLSYYGTILGAVATIVAVIMTILFTVGNQKEEKKASSKPYLKTRMKLLSDIPYEKLPNKFICIHRNKGWIMVDDELPKDLELIVENNYHLNIKEVNSTNCDHINYIREHCVVLYTIKNVGFNTAVDVSLAIGDMTLKDAMCVNTNEEINIVLIFDSSFYKKKVDLTFTYFDIYSIAKYKQDESVYIDDEIELLPSITQFGDDRLTKPVEINKK